jgi:hypothetical protein
MKNVTTAGILSAIFLLVMSCSLIDRFTGGGPQMTRVDELWSDVPRMDGLAHSDLELPLTIKILMRTALNNLWRLNKEGEDKTPVSGDWVVFTSSGSPSDVQSYYTNSRMTSFGNWQASKEKTCLDGKGNGVDGVLCAFEKVADKKDIMLAIIAMTDEKSKQTNVFYLRLEKDADANVVNSNNTNPEPGAKPKGGPITRLVGSAPYGIEKRPIPSGTDLDQLLPRQVGPYTRVALEKSQQRGTTATSIETDGNSVYATYKNGDKEIFVEYSVASTPENAQAGWDVVVGDANEGIYPSDPRLASFRTEPSYLKVVNGHGAFFAWTRSGYFITANAKGGEADLDAFMNAFPY